MRNGLAGCALIGGCPAGIRAFRTKSEHPARLAFRILLNSAVPLNDVLAVPPFRPPYARILQALGRLWGEEIRRNTADGEENLTITRKGEYSRGAVMNFHGRELPGPGRLAGYAGLVSELGLYLPTPRRLSLFSVHHERRPEPK